MELFSSALNATHGGAWMGVKIIVLHVIERAVTVGVALEGGGGGGLSGSGPLLNKTKGGSSHRNSLVTP